MSSAFWSLSLYPDAGEAGGCFIPTRHASTGGFYATPAVDPLRAREEAARRARGKVRRYCAANRLTRLGTLTYAGVGCHDERLVRAHVAEFFRALRTDLGGKPFPYLWVPEWHKTDHGLHLHFGVGQYIKRSRIEQAWGRGFVHIKLLSDLPVGSGALGEARRTAGYLGKYVGKDFARPEGTRLHRYEIAQGFQPKVIGLRDRTAHAVLYQAMALMGREPARHWSSDQVEDWKGSPAVWVAWG
jgi:hypothetical protein